MEQSDEEVAAQKSTRRSAWQVRWPGTKQGQAAGKSGERAQGRISQKPAKDTCLSAQRAAATSRSPQAVKFAIALVRERFGYFAIGLGESGIRYRPSIID